MSRALPLHVSSVLLFFTRNTTSIIHLSRHVPHGLLCSLRRLFLVGSASVH